jgi:hypothetical protein
MKFIYTLILLSVSAFPAANISWQHPDDTATYNIYRATGACSVPSTFAKVGTSTVRSYTDSPPVGRYCYRVTAVVGGVESVPSSTLEYASLPPAPTDLRIAGQIALVVPDGWTGRYGRKGNTFYWPEPPYPEIKGFGWAIVRGLEHAPVGTEWIVVTGEVERG